MNGARHSMEWTNKIINEPQVTITKITQTEQQRKNRLNKTKQESESQKSVQL